MAESVNDKIRLQDPLAGKLYILPNQQSDYISQALSLFGPKHILLHCILPVPHCLTRDGVFFL